MNKIFKFSIDHPLSILMYVILFLMLGLISIFTIKMDYLPYISDKNLLVTTILEGLPASQMKEMISIPEEDALSSLKGIKNISSVTRDSISFIHIELQSKTDINTALLETRQIIDQIYPTLPDKTQKPKAEIFSTAKNLLMTIAVIVPKDKLSQARYSIEKHIKHELQKIKGCGKIEISGGLKEQITLETDINLLNSKGLTLSNLADAIESTNFEYPAGTIKDETNEYILKTSHLYTDQSELLQTPILYNNNIYSLSDFATVTNDFEEKECFCLSNLNETIEIKIYKKNDESPVTLSKNLKQYIKSLESKYSDYQFKIINDASIQIKNNIILIYISALLGTIICFLILFLFYKDIFISFTVASVIPLCIIISITVLKLCGKNINLFSLSGLSISLGMVVDPSIILIQKIIQSASIKTQDNDSLIKSNNFPSVAKQIILKSSEEVIQSNFSSSLTTIIVFLPFFLLPGIFGELFCDLSIAVISSIFFSFLLSITYIPAISTCLLKRRIFKINKSPEFTSLKNHYKIFISRNIMNTKSVLNILSISLILIFTISFFITKEVMPIPYSKTFSFSIEYPSNYTLKNIQTQTYKLNQNLLTNFPNINIYSKGGIDSTDFSMLSDFKLSNNTVTYEIKTDSTNQKQKIQNFLNTQSINYLILENEDIISQALNLKSTYLVQLPKDKQKNEALIHTNAKPNYIKNEISFIPDTNKCSYYKIPKNYISYYCYQIINGLSAGELYTNEKYIPIKIKPDKPIQQNFQIQYGNITIPLSSLGSFTINESEKILYRYNKCDTKVINEPKLIDSNLTITESNKEQFHELLSNTILLLFIVFILLYCFLGAQFESFVLPLVLLLTMLPAAAGSLLSLFLTSNSININSILSLVVLFGTCVNNAIIFYEAIIYTKHKQAITITCSNEISSIILTTITSVAALIPFTVDPFHINSQISISISLCGGLLISMISTSYIYPIIFNKLRVNKNES